MAKEAASVLPDVQLPHVLGLVVDGGTKGTLSNDHFVASLLEWYEGKRSEDRRSEQCRTKTEIH